MHNRRNRTWGSLALMLALGAMLPSGAMAGFNMAGYDLRIVKAERCLKRAAVAFRTNPVWIGAVPDKPYQFTTQFALPAAEEILFARLYLNVWGGTNEYTCRLDTTVNGAPLEVVDIGGTADANPIYDADRTCVYGSGYGTWQVAYSGVARRLNCDGTDNLVGVTVSDPTGQFDGRVVDVTLVAVYRDPSLKQAVDFYLAEADGSLRRAPGAVGSPAERVLDINDIDTSNVLFANYTAHYTHGTKGQYDQIYFNGELLGGDDVAIGEMGTYGPDVLTFDVTDLLGADSTVRYTVDESVVPKPSEFSVMAKIALLEIGHSFCAEPIPGDLNGDCRVDFADLAIMAANWMACHIEP